jgi:ferritin-like metal-binding protein YciE
MTEAVGAGAPRLPLDESLGGDVALNNPLALFQYELSGMYDAEHKIAEMLGELTGQIQDGDLAQTLRTDEQKARQKISSLEQCFQAIGAQAERVPCPPIDGMRQDLRQVMEQNPSPDVLGMKALGTAMKVAHFEIASYRGLLDKAVLVGDTPSSQILQTILVQVEEAAATHERLSHEMSQRVLAPA